MTGSASEKHPANTINDRHWKRFTHGRARALEKMPPSLFDKHRTT